MSDNLIDFLEDNLHCQHGFQGAYFDLPQKDKDPIRVVYVTYAVCAKTRESADDFMLENVFKPLVKEGKYLYWRLKECVDRREVDGNHELYTRIAVLDENLDAVVIEDKIKPEGAIVTMIDGLQSKDAFI
jgi:hypothetical protein